MKQLIKKIFKKSKAQKRVEKKIEQYNIDSLSCLYFPDLNKHIEQKRKVERFFTNLITEC